MMPRRSYDQYCSVARALDSVGDRWTLLIVRELLAGARRYTDLHADLPGVSTDMLAGRLKDMERDGLAVRRRLDPPAAAFVYELTDRGRALLPVLTALADWGAPELGAPRPTDAVRAHWFAVPLMPRLARYFAGRRAEDGPVRVVEVRLDEGTFHVTLDEQAAAQGRVTDACGYAEGPAPAPDAVLELDTAACAEVIYDRLSLAEGVGTGRVRVTAHGEPAVTAAPASTVTG
ncbi:helix-turn-helix domain-containing protein [Streptomyces sp. NPDC047117]|uniref:winged helix-turn-helix transcriptional regulator n=1 Tax=Streptomyces sp. NPDC047117 TaxID=3155379 RepID=UPI0033CBBE79